STLKTETTIPAGSTGEVTQEATVTSPNLWSVSHPVLYKALTQVLAGSEVTDDYETPFGIRYFAFDREKGFFLNGEPMKILGVCNHHDLGCLGAAINTRALERQLEILKAMGANAIRTSHNPPAPELLNLCDRMGFLVMDEAFDMWKINKTPFDYGLDFDEWHQADLRDMILRDRNHPSVIIWSIGNEIPEQWDTSGLRIAPELAGIVKSLDPTRPITSACNNPNPKNYIIRSNVLDLIGYNYHIEYFPSFLDSFQRGAFIASETTSALATRGSYDMPSDSVRIWPTDWRSPDMSVMNKDFTCSAYDNCRVPWGSTHEATWKVIKKYDFLSGLFIWTGFDYLGEPTPYPWPARSSYFGIVDLAGFPKDAYYMYQSEWTNTPVLHIFPHWNWKEGQTVDVWAYTNAEEVELFLNGKSMGTKRKQGDDLHLMWRLTWEPGTVKAIARTGGKEVLTKEIHTAGKPARILLEPDRTKLKADGKDLSFVKISILDDKGNIVPYADNLVKFEVNGAGKLRATDNGNPVSMESFQTSERKAFHGLCLAVIQASDKAGKITLKAVSDGLPEASVTIAAE
ncbi:MAG: glycoside hydrolase family 2 protein, partial [Bacteroidales bacterium]|nr:glycoside hydrolase family 2 protein [Bacteroidales bacterium]